MDLFTPYLLSACYFPIVYVRVCVHVDMNTVLACRRPHFGEQTTV